MFIVIEGLDGTGKSTIAKSLAKKLDAVLLSTPDKVLKDARPIVEKAYEDSPLARQLFYASSVVHLSDKIKTLLAEAKNVVVDRYWLSTQVYHNWKCNGDHFLLNDLEQYIIKPDFTIYLELSLEERASRLSKRSENTVEDNLTLMEGAHEVLNQGYHSSKNSKTVGTWVMLDASKQVQDITVEAYDMIAASQFK